MVVYGSSGGSIMWVLGWVVLVSLGLRYRLLCFRVLQVGLSYGSFRGVGVEV